MREIGGFLELEIKQGSEQYHKNAIALNLARNAVKYLLLSKKIKKIYLPYFLCDCIEIMLVGIDIIYEKYHVDECMIPQIEKRMDDNEIILIVNYYGQLQQEEIFDFKRKYGNIILDNTHAFFEKRIDGIDTVYCARKYFGVPDGAYLYSDKIFPLSLEKSDMADCYEHLVGRHEGGAERYYSAFRTFETRMNNEDLKEMSTCARLILSNVDYDKIQKTRMKNFKYLHGKLKGINLLSIKNEKATYMYPLRIGRASTIRKKLISKKIYVPILWPNVLDDASISECELYLVKDILPLPIDQRYTEKDMKYIVDCIYDCASDFEGIGNI